VGLQLIDVSMPSLATPICTVGSSVRGDAVAVESGVAYLADRDTDNGGLRIFDVSNPLLPTESGLYSLSFGNRRDVTLVGNQAYLSRGGFGFQSVDISTASAVGLIAEVDISSLTENVAVEGDYAYIVTRSSGELRVYDISDPLAPTLTGSLDLDSFVNAFAVVVKNNRAYIASSGGLVIVDVSAPSMPIVFGVDSEISLQYATDIKVTGNLAFVSQPGSIFNPQGGIFIFDASDPAAPVLLRNYDGDLARVSSYSAIDLQGDTVFASPYSDSPPTKIPNIHILDAADPANVTLMGKFRASDHANDITVNGNYFYVATETDGLGVMQKAPDLSPRYIQDSVTTAFTTQSPEKDTASF